MVTNKEVMINPASKKLTTFLWPTLSTNLPFTGWIKALEMLNPAAIAPPTA